MALPRARSVLFDAVELVVHVLPVRVLVAAWPVGLGGTGFAGLARCLRGGIGGCG